MKAMKYASERHTGDDRLLVSSYNFGNNNPENLLDFVTILQEELIAARVLPPDHNFEVNKETGLDAAWRCTGYICGQAPLGRRFLDSNPSLFRKWDSENLQGGIRNTASNDVRTVCS